MTRKKTVSLPIGTKEIVITGISPNVDRNTVQSKILGNATLLSSSYSINYLEELQDTKFQKTMKDSLKLINEQISILKYKKSVLNGEVNLIEQNKKLGGEQNRISVEDLTKLSTFYSKRMLVLKKALFKNSQKKQHLVDTKNRLNQWLQTNRVKKNPIGEITLRVETTGTTGTTKLSIECQYLVNNAGWTPVYDIRANNSDEDIQLEYKAQVYQSTGIEWNNLPLTISTGNPSSYSIKPTLNPLFVRFQQGTKYDENLYYKKLSYNKEGFVTRGQEEEWGDDWEEEVASIEESYIEKELQVETSTNTLTVEYEIKNLQTIKNNGSIHLVKLNKVALPTKFEHHAIPKLSNQVYLQAKLSDWAQYNLEPAQATIFFEGMYIGKTYLNPQATNDTMQISLGVDHNVQVKRTQLTDYKAKKFIGTKRTKTLAYEIEVKNNKTTPINLLIEDQYPISQNSEIEVEVLENGDSRIYESLGKLIWKESIPANTSKRHSFAYLVRYPKSETITTIK